MPVPSPVSTAVPAVSSGATAAQSPAGVNGTRSDRRLRGTGRKERVADQAQILDRSGDVAGIDVEPRLRAVGHLARRLVGSVDLRVLGVQHVAAPAQGQEPLDLVTGERELREGILRERLLDLRPARLPLLQVETRFVDTHENVMRRRGGAETPWE